MTKQAAERIRALIPDLCTLKEKQGSYRLLIPRDTGRDLNLWLRAKKQCAAEVDRIQAEIDMLLDTICVIDEIKETYRPMG